MNLSKLMVLGLLASHGPRHGHQIRRDAERTNVGNWGGVNVGALYRELQQMQREGLVEPVRSEQVGRRPTRTVYRLTEAGGRALRDLRAEAVRSFRFGPDAFGVALVFVRTWGRPELADLLRDRRQAIAEALAGLEAVGSDLQARGEIGPLDLAMFRRRAMQLEAELRWHDEFAGVLASLPEPDGQATAKDAEASATAVSTAPAASPGAETGQKSPGRDPQADQGRGTEKKRRGT